MSFYKIDNIYRIAVCSENDRSTVFSLLLQAHYIKKYPVQVSLITRFFLLKMILIRSEVRLFFPNSCFTNQLNL